MKNLVLVFFLVVLSTPTYLESAKIRDILTKDELSNLINEGKTADEIKKIATHKYNQQQEQLRLKKEQFSKQQKIKQKENRKIIRVWYFTIGLLIFLVLAILIIYFKKSQRSIMGWYKGTWFSISFILFFGSIIILNAVSETLISKQGFDGYLRSDEHSIMTLIGLCLYFVFAFCIYLFTKNTNFEKNKTISMYIMYVVSFFIFPWIFLIVMYIFGMWTYKKNIDSKKDNTKTKTDKELDFYEIAFNEVEDNNLNKGLWAKAFSKEQGDNNKTKSLYIKYRVEMLKKEYINH